MATTNRGRPRGNGSNNDSSVREVVGGYAGGFIEAVKARPLRTAAIAAGAAGASAFLWARRAQLADQVSNLGDAISERFVSNEGEQSGTSSARDSEIGGGSSSTDPMRSEQSAVGAISY